MADGFEPAIVRWWSRNFGTPRQTLVWNENEQVFDILPGHSPYPLKGQDGTARSCVWNGECGCNERESHETKLLTKRPRTSWLAYNLVMHTPLWFAGNPYTAFGRWCLENAGNWAYRDELTNSKTAG